MHLGFARRVRHPLYPRLAAAAAGRGGPRVAPALAGTLEELRRAAAEGTRATRALFVLVEQERPTLTGAERDFLWECFQVPAFLLLRDAGGKILGYECEAQDGFHLEAGDVHLDGALPVSKPCECGRPGHRVRVDTAAYTETASACSAATRPSEAGLYPACCSADPRASRISSTFSAVEP
jgi:hypothetical protein